VLIDLQSLWERNFRLNRGQGSTDNSYSIIGAPSLDAYILGVTNGIYTLTGSDVTFIKTSSGFTITSDSGTYVLTGTASGLLSARVLPGGPASGVYSLTGTAANLRATHLLIPDSGTYLVSGATLNLPAARLLALSAGGYTITGSTVTLLRPYLILASSGSYQIIDLGETQLISSGGTPITTHLLPIMGLGS